jgi:uncharacterized protein YjbI with pentapeptide repeats
LDEIDMSGFDLRDVDFSSASLRRVNLTNANLSRATFDGANLATIKAPGAVLYFANFRGADLSSANLNGAILISADFSGSNLSGASLVGAYLWRAVFFGANLSRARVWGTSPPRPKAFALAAVSGIRLGKPADSILEEAKSRGKQSAGLTVGPNYSVPEFDYELLDANAWNASEERATWLTVLTQARIADNNAALLGDFLADLSCQHEHIFGGIVRHHFLPTGFGYWDAYYPFERVVPRGVSDKDLNQAEEEKPTPPTDKTFWTRYREHGALIRTFADRASASRCGEAMTEKGASTMVRLREAADIAKKSDTGTDLFLAVFDP